MTDPYLDVIRAFNHAAIAYVVIGVSGINYFIDDTLDIIMTADYDVFLKPSRTNVGKALGVMQSLGYKLFSGGRIHEQPTDEQIASIVTMKNPVVCQNPEHVLVELCLEISGYTFEELNRNAVFISIGAEKVRVGSLRDLLHSKRVAGRPKDKLFLQKYATLLGR